MVYEAQPSSGWYRIKQHGRSGCWKFVPDTDQWIELAPLVDSNSHFMWEIYPVSGQRDTFTISPFFDPSIGMARSPPSREQYRGYGFVKGRAGASANWRIIPDSTESYSRIHIEGSPDAVTCLGIGNDNCVHFHYDNNLSAQHWVFERV